MPHLHNDAAIAGRARAGAPGAWYGVYPALVADINDPDGRGRVKVRLPWAPDPDGERYEVWARLATLMAGNRRGSWFVPDVNDEVLVAFESGDVRRPYVVGALWNGEDVPPETMDAGGHNDRKVLRSRSGLTIALDDTAGQEQLVLSTPAGQRLVMTDGRSGIVISDSNGNSITLDARGVSVTTGGTVTVQASQLSVSAGHVRIDAGMVRCSGVVQAETVITNSVISSSYTPGAGNIW